MIRVQNKTLNNPNFAKASNKYLLTVNKYKKCDFCSVHYFSVWHFKIFKDIDKWLHRFSLTFQIHTRNCHHQYTNMPDFREKYYWWYFTIYFNRMRWKTYACYCFDFYWFYPTLVLLLLGSDEKQLHQSKVCHKSLNFIRHKLKTVWSQMHHSLDITSDITIVHRDVRHYNDPVTGLPKLTSNPANVHFNPKVSCVP